MAELLPSYEFNADVRDRGYVRGRDDVRDREAREREQG